MHGNIAHVKIIRNNLMIGGLVFGNAFVDGYAVSLGGQRLAEADFLTVIESLFTKSADDGDQNTQTHK